MTERAPAHHEHSKNKEVATEPAVESRVEHHEHHEHHEADSSAKIEALKQKAEREAVSKHKVQVDAKEPIHSQTIINRELKLLTLKRTLSRLRRHLSGPEKVFSKIIHQPAVDKVSRAGEKTIARPYGILAAGVTALLGSSILLLTAKHYGFRYNLSVFFILLATGYLGGTFLEVLVRALNKKR